MSRIAEVILTMAMIGLTNFSSKAATSEEKKDIKGSYEFIFTFSESNSPQFKKNDSNTKIRVIHGAKLSVIEVTENDVIYQYWDYSVVKDTTIMVETKNEDVITVAEKDTCVKDSTLYKKYNDGNVFQMSMDEFIQNTKPIYSRYKGASVGAYTVPFRLRSLGGEDFNFESSLSLQANLVFGFGSRYKKESLVDASVGVGITSVDLTPQNSSLETGERTATALTFSIGALINFTQTANIGIFYGVDLLGQTDSDMKWKHDGKGWLGIGINVSFNIISTDNTNTDFENK